MFTPTVTDRMQVRSPRRRRYRRLSLAGSDSLLALDPQTEEWVVTRVPYPMGFYSRGLDGRIDDRDAGWKGRGVRANYGTNFNWHTEGGKGTTSKMVKFQVRPNPLAR
jgi:hypothetical protein